MPPTTSAIYTPENLLHIRSEMLKACAKVEQAAQEMQDHGIKAITVKGRAELERAMTALFKFGQYIEEGFREAQSREGMYGTVPMSDMSDSGKKRPKPRKKPA